MLRWYDRDNIWMCIWMWHYIYVMLQTYRAHRLTTYPTVAEKDRKSSADIVFDMFWVWDLVRHDSAHDPAHSAEDVVDCLVEPAAGAFQRVTKTQGWDRDGGNWCVRVYFGRECKGRLYIECFATHGVLNTLLGLGAGYFMHGKQQ